MVAAPAAWADGDPASDVLLYQSTFFPYTSPSSGAKASLVNAVNAAKRAGFPIRIAVIQSTQDLGADPELFGKPKLYARFLDSELLSAHYFGVLVVVMPQGYGVAGGGRLIDHRTKFRPRPIGPFEKVLAELRRPGTTDVDALTAAGVVAVRVVAKAAGHPIPGAIPKLASHAPVPPAAVGGRASRGSELAALGALLLLAVALVAFGIRRRRPRTLGS